MSIYQNGTLKNNSSTALVYQRINKKLVSNFSNKEIEVRIKKVLQASAFYEKLNKNYYIPSKENNIKTTIKATTFRAITVNEIIK